MERVIYSHEKIPDRDIKLLTGLYENRALTTEQIMRMYDYPKWYLYKKLVELRAKGYIISENVLGYIARQSRQGKYHRIGDAGIRLLKSIGYPTNYIAADLRVNRNRLPFLLSTNDLMIDLKPYGWSIMDSREVKRKYSINRNDNIHGVLISPKKKTMPFYVFINPIKSTSKILNEVARYDFTDMIIFTKSEESFEQAIEIFGNNSDIVKYQSFRILPYGFAKYYLRKFNEPQNLAMYLEENYDLDLIGMSNSRFTDLKTVVKHRDKEKYLVNLLDNDLEKVYQIKRYRKENYEKDGRRVLVVTNEKLIERHKEMLQHIFHVDYLIIDSRRMMDYLSEE